MIEVGTRVVKTVYWIRVGKDETFKRKGLKGNGREGKAKNLGRGNRCRVRGTNLVFLFCSTLFCAVHLACAFSCGSVDQENLHMTSHHCCQDDDIERN